MDARFIVGQVFGFVALLFVCVSYFCKNRATFLSLNIVANIFYGGAFLTQNLLVAGINTLISIARTVGLFILVKDKKTPQLWYFFLIISAYFIVTSIFFSSPLDFIALATSVLFTVAYFVPSLHITRLLVILPNIALAVYNFVFHLYVSAALNAIEAVVALVALLKMSSKSNRTSGKTEQSQNSN